MRKIIRFLTLTLLLCCVALFAEAQSLLLVNPDGTVDTLSTAAGATIGEGVEYTPDALASQSFLLWKYLSALAIVLLTYASRFIPGIRNWKPPVLDSKRVTTIVIALVAGAGFLGNYETGGWLKYVLQNFDLLGLATGIYTLFIKPLLAKNEPLPPQAEV